MRGLFIFSFFLLGIPFLLLAQDEASYHPLGEWSPVTSQFGYRDDPIYGGRTEAFHKGIDLDCELGDSVYAWREGIVTFTGYNKLSGNMIDISHSNGYVSKYHHLYRIYVEKGETIAAGQVIGKAGRSGKVTGAHLHFTIMKDGKYKNPLPFLKKAQTVPQSVSLVSSPDVQINKFFTIKSIPVSGKVYIDDTYYGTTPLTVELPYGKHTVEIDAGRGYQNYKEEILVDQDFDYLFSARLEIQPATPVAQADDNQPLADTHPAEVQINKTNFGGVTINANMLRPLDNVYSQEIDRVFGLEIGYGKFWEFPDWYIRDHLIDVRFAFAFGKFETPDDGDRRWEDLSIWSGAIGYHPSPSLSQRFSLLLGGEFTFGKINMDGIEETGNAQTSIGSGVKKISEDSRYFALAYSIGGLLFLNKRFALTGRYYRTLFATESNWAGFKIGLLTALFTR